MLRKTLLKALVLLRPVAHLALLLHAEAVRTRQLTDRAQYWLLARVLSASLAGHHFDLRSVSRVQILSLGFCSDVQGYARYFAQAELLPEPALFFLQVVVERADLCRLIVFL